MGKAQLRTRGTHRTTKFLTLCSLSALAGASLGAPAAHANIGDDYGYGPRSASLAGSSVAWNFDGFSAYNNPAGLPLINSSGVGFSDERFIFSYGLIYMNPEFTPISGVVTQNSFSSGGGSPVTGDVNTSYKATFGQMFGAAWRADPEFYNLSFGLTMFFPFAQLAYIDSGETLQPEYVLYRDRTQQPDISFSGAIEPFKGFRIGVGMHVDYTLQAQSDSALLQSAPSNARLQTSIAPKVTPFFGVQFSKDDEHALGFVARLPSSFTSSITLNTNYQATGFLPTVPAAFAANDTIIYNPLTLSLGGMEKVNKRARLFGELDYEAWSHFQPPYLFISNPCVGDGCGLSVQSGPTLDAQYRDILIERVGAEFTLPHDMTLRLGWAYRPSMFRSTPSGVGNYLDPSKHLINAGMGFVFDRFLGYRKPWNLDFSLDYQALVSEQVTKSAGDETGNTSSQKIGAPGYTAGGHVFGGQIALSVGI